MPKIDYDGFIPDYSDSSDGALQLSKEEKTFVFERRVIAAQESLERAKLEKMPGEEIKRLEVEIEKLNAILQGLKNS